MNEEIPNQATEAVLAGGGEFGARMRALDWATTPLGAVDTWPQSLRSVVSMLLPSKAQIILFWGPEFVVLYNDAYRPVFGAKHPHALGRPGREAWSEIWDTVLHDLLAGVVRTGEAFWGKDLLFMLERHGFVEETYFDVSYDPVRVESGGVGGVYCIVAETTERVVGGRRMALLQDLAARQTTARTTEKPTRSRWRRCRRTPQDITFALAYVDDELQSCTPGAEARLRRDANRDLVRELPVFTAGLRRPRRSARRRPESRNVRSTISTARFSSSSPASWARRSRTRAPTKKSGGAPKRSPRSIARRRRSSPTSPTSSGRR